MGGNAFKDLETVRLSTRELEKLSKRVVNELRNFKVYWEQFSYIEPIPYYKEKESHRDLDILVSCSDYIWSYFTDALTETHDNVYHNKNVISYTEDVSSFLCSAQYFQVDIIRVDREDFKSALNYYSFNDLGNLIGRIYHNLGLKYGHNGLSYIHRNGDHVCFKINVSKCLYEIYEFIGLSYKTEFKNLQDIFEFVSSSKYFNPDIYLLQNRNNKSRARDRKRKTYMEFLDWCSALPEKEWFVREDKKIHQLNALKFFDVYDLYQEKLEDHEKELEFNKKINGNKLKELFSGLQDKEIGRFKDFIGIYYGRDVIVNAFSSELETLLQMAYRVWRNR